MVIRRTTLASAALCAFLAIVAAAQMPFRTYEPMEGEDSESPLPPDYKKPADFVLGRLIYPARGFGGGAGMWTVDYPRGDRTFAAAIRRLTLVDVRSVEQPTSPDDGDDIYNWPYLHVGMPTRWNLSDAQAAKIREFLLRGGFMLCDSYFGTQEWEGFMVGMRKIFPDRQIVELADGDPMFHTVYDASQRYQIANFRSMLRNGHTYRGDGSHPYWRAIKDDKGRVMVAMTFNNDLGDSWQLADDPRYPEKYSALGIRVGVDYVVYTLTH